MPLSRNPLFPPSMEPGSFRLWRQKGLATVKDLFVDGVFATFEQLVEKFELPRTDFFKYLQVRHFYRKIYTDFPNLPPDISVDKIFRIPLFPKGLISILYTTILSLCSSSDETLLELWSQDLGMDLTMVWDWILGRVHSSSVCARHGVIQCKLLHRVYWTKARLSRVYPNTDPLCDRCRQHRGTLVHMFWTCPSLHTCWCSIFSSVSDVLQIELDPCPIPALFGVLPDTIKISSSKLDFAAFLFLIARRLILIYWKSKHPPSHSLWIKDVLFFSKLEKIRHLKKGAVSKFYKVWEPFLTHVESLDMPLPDPL